MKTVQTHALAMVSAIKGNAFVTQDGLEMTVVIRYAHQTARVMVNALMDYVSVIKDSKEQRAQNLM